MSAGQQAAGHTHYRLYGSALTLVADMAAELGDEELLQLCRSKERELSQAAGLAPSRPAW